MLLVNRRTQRFGRNIIYATRANMHSTLRYSFYLGNSSSQSDPNAAVVRDYVRITNSQNCKSCAIRCIEMGTDFLHYHVIVAIGCIEMFFVCKY